MKIRDVHPGDLNIVVPHPHDEGIVADVAKSITCSSEPWGPRTLLRCRPLWGDQVFVYHRTISDFANSTWVHLKEVSEDE